MKLLALLLLCLPLSAGTWHRARVVAQVAVGIAAGADITSSVGHVEINPAFGRPAPFGFRQGTILGAVSIGGLALQCWSLRHPHSDRVEKWTAIGDFGGAAFHGALAVHNAHLK